MRRINLEQVVEKNLFDFISIRHTGFLSLIGIWNVAWKSNTLFWIEVEVITNKWRKNICNSYFQIWGIGYGRMGIRMQMFECQMRNNIYVYRFVFFECLKLYVSGMSSQTISNESLRKWTKRNTHHGQLDVCVSERLVHRFFIIIWYSNKMRPF